VACAQEYKWPEGMGGIRVIVIVENLPNDKNYLKFMPMQKELCILCAGRTKRGEKPACVNTSMSACLKYGKIQNLAKEINKPRMVLWAPRV